MKNYFFLLLFFQITNGIAQSWQRVQLMPIDSTGGPVMLDGVAYGDTCIIAEKSGCFIRSTDFFQSFVIDSIFKGYLVHALSFADKSNGYATSTYAHGGTLRTLDGGLTWNELTGGNIVHSPGDILFFSTSDTGYVASSSISGRFTHTWDGGLIWADSTILDYDCPSIFRIQFVNDSTGYILSSDNSSPPDGIGALHIFKSIDYGNNWQDITTFDIDHYPKGFGDLQFIDDTTAILVDDHVILKSRDGGYSFDTVMVSDYPLDYLGTAMHAISFPNHDTGFVAYQLNVYRTYNAGSTWEKTDFALDSLDLNNGNGIWFIKASTSKKIFVGCQMGAIYKTETGGGLSTTVSDVKPVLNFVLYPNPADRILKINLQNSNLNSLGIVIMDISGQILMHQVINPGTKNELDVSSLAAGIYFLQLQDGQQNMVSKFVKE